jgi:hypothetical protein
MAKRTTRSRGCAPSSTRSGVRRDPSAHKALAVPIPTEGAAACLTSS